MMKPFHIITALFAGGILSVYLLPLTESWRIAILISLVAMYLILLIYGASVIGSQFFVSTLCRGNPEEKYVAITFDDGPCGERSLEILEILQKFSCTATFF